MDKQELRSILVTHIAQDKASHDKLVDALTKYVASRPGDHESFIGIFVDHVNGVEAEHVALLELLDND